MRIKPEYTIEELTGMTLQQVKTMVDTVKPLVNEPGFEFDYPDYAGLDKEISNLLSGDTVDSIQYYFSYNQHLIPAERIEEKIVEILIKQQ